MNKLFYTCIFLWILNVINTCYCTEEIDNDDDSRWLESILSAPRARLDQSRHYIYSNDVYERLKLVEDFLYSKDDDDSLLRRFANLLKLNNRLSSYRKQRSWIEDDPGNRATDTTPTVPTTTSSTTPVSTTTTTTTTTTAATTTASGRANNIPQFPGFPGWSPPWSRPFGWGKRKRRALVSNRKFEIN